MLFIEDGAPVIVQGMTGHQGMTHTARMLKAGTNIVGGVNPQIAPLLATMRQDGVVLDATVRIYEAMKTRPSKPYCSVELAAQLTAQALKAGVTISAGTACTTGPGDPLFSNGFE